MQAPAVTTISITNDPLLKPLSIKSVRFRNRVMSTSHACGLERDGMPAERYQRYHEEKAKGGLALTMFGGSSNVSPDSPNVFRQLNVGDDAIIPYLQEFSERIHQYDTRLMCQITHLGRRGEFWASNWLSTIGPSPVREPLHRSFPKEMDRHDIERVVKEFGEAAWRCQQGGLDGIEVMAASHLIGQFMSPTTNHRTDAFGGSLENRCRFALMVLKEIRRRVGDGFLLGIRHTVDEGTEGWLTFDESLAAVQLLEREGLLDFVNAIYGRMDTDVALTVDNMPGMASPIAPWLERVGSFKREIGLPVFHAARISDVATARHAIRDGLLDMVAMTRAHIADPYIVRKLEAGKEHTIRPCVGATQCQSPLRPACIHNPSSGREATLPHRIERSSGPRKKVVIVGGGPAGLEAARVSAARGHRVVLFEAGPKLGGQILLASRTGWRRDLIGIVDWRAQELERLDVAIRLDAYAEEQDVLAEEPDIVVIATGGTPDMEWIGGTQHCTSVWDVLSGNVALKSDVIVYDGTGRNPAAQAAELATLEKRSVRFFSSDGYLAQELPYAERVIWKKRFYEHAISATFDVDLIDVSKQGGRITGTFRNVYTGEVQEVEADQLVIEHGTLPCDELYYALRERSSNDGVTSLTELLAGVAQPAGARPGVFQLHRIGDAVSSRNIHAAILDAARLCSPF
ncbi:FAD-dependent oxidoreductase [Paraburkholderia sp. DGU8]|uniref:oxidoreductase n=1 Tax=Paraburkholderia sp. DGU8 TaxID=3161997 RepID=UPI003467B624